METVEANNSLVFYHRFFQSLPEIDAAAVEILWRDLNDGETAIFVSIVEPMVEWKDLIESVGSDLGVDSSIEFHPDHVEFFLGRISDLSKKFTSLGAVRAKQKEAMRIILDRFLREYFGTPLTLAYDLFSIKSEARKRLEEAYLRMQEFLRASGRPFMGVLGEGNSPVSAWINSNLNQP